MFSIVTHVTHTVRLGYLWPIEKVLFLQPTRDANWPRLVSRLSHSREQLSNGVSCPRLLNKRIPSSVEPR